MLSTRSQNLITSTSTGDIFPSSSTRHFSCKTPARLKHGRAVHDENSIYGHPKTAGLTGRKKSSLLFRSPDMNGLPARKAPRTVCKSTALTEITNQTPFSKACPPVTPGPTSLKPSKSFVVFNESSVGSPRISSTRKKPRLPRSASKSFETPETTGNHWDVSDGSIEASIIEETSIVEEDYDDVEYAPPTAIEPEFDPGFDMPDYKEVGATFMSLFRQTAIFDEYIPVTGSDDTDLLNDPVIWERLELPKIPPDDLFPFMVHTEIDQETGSMPHKVVPMQGPRPFGEDLRHGPVVRPIASTRIPSAPSTSNASLSKPAKPATARATVTSHTRIPSLSKPKVPPTPLVTPKVVISTKPTHIGHARTGSMVPKRTNVMHSRTLSMPPRATTVSKLVAKPVSGSGRNTNALSQQFNIADDTILSLLAGPTDETLEEEFLFKI
ncbi:hypothetical protein K439DRAFT_1632169 [Ramaria rubella]|nr:hypothetical protein K439DRAFT_1632169 [Ramaria rubella]